MPAESILESIIAIGDKIDTLWNMFIGIHIAILGYFYVSKELPSPYHKFVGSIAYLLFSIINLNALNSTYRFLGAMVDEYKMRYIETTEVTGPHLKNILLNMDYSNRYIVVYSIHLLAASLVFMSFFLSKKLNILNTEKQG